MGKSKDPNYDTLRNRSLLGKIRQNYCNQRTTSRKRGHSDPMYTVEELTTWALANGWEALHEAWVASDYNRYMAPSFDRLDNTKPYTLDNLRLGTWRANLDAQKEQNMSGQCVPVTAKAVNQYTLTGVFIARHESAANALRSIIGTNKSVSNITQVCAGKLNTAYGYTWKFADDS